MKNDQQHQEDLQRIRGFRLIDDDFMNACFDNNIEGTELILRIILNKGVAAMCKVMEDMRNEVQNEVRIENARRMIADGLPLEKVAEYSGLSMENVQELAGEKGA